MSNPSVWNRRIEVIENNGDISHGEIELVDLQAECVIPEADVETVRIYGLLIIGCVIPIG